MKVKLTKEGEERYNRLRSENKCLHCGEPLVPGEKVVCGCHVGCDQSQRNAINTGRTTQNQLIKEGKRTIPYEHGRGRKPKSAATAELLGRPVSKPA